MQILFLTHRLPYPPDKGEKIRAFYELKYLGARHEVDVFCLSDSGPELENQAQLRQFCRSVQVATPGKSARMLRSLRSLASGHPSSFGYFDSPELRRAVRQALDTHRYDCIFVNCSSMAQYVPRPAPAPVVVDFVDADSNKFRQYAENSTIPGKWFYAHEADRVAAAEREIGRFAALSLVVTPYDAAELGGSGWNGSKIEVLSMGVDLPRSASALGAEVAALQPFVLFLGTMSYRPNCDAADYFAREIYPLVRKVDPKLTFVIAGRDPSPQVRRLAQIPGVVVTGAVPDAFQYFRAAHVSVASFRISQGFQSKIAESLALGTPVVASSRAASGIGLSEREGLFVAGTPEDFASQVTAIAANPILREKLRASAPAAHKLLSWESRLRRLDELLSVAVSKSTKSMAPVFATK